MSNNRIFCGYPWYGIKLRLDGYYGPCSHVTFKGDFPETLEDLMALYNSPDMQNLRQNLLDGKEVDWCTRCFDRNFDKNRLVFFARDKHLPRQSRKGAEFDTRYDEANQAYVEGRLELDQPPLQVVIFCNEACNLDCRMCFQHESRKAHRTYPMESAFKVIEAIGWDQLDQVAIIGGEIMANKDGLAFIDWVNSIDTKKTSILLATNGTLIKRQLDRMRNIKELTLKISVDGYGETYERIRRKSHWDPFVESIKSIDELRGDRDDVGTMFSSIMMRSTLPQIADIMRFAHDAGGSVLFFPLALGSYLPDEPRGLPLEYVFRHLDAGIAYGEESKDEHAVDTLHKLKALFAHWDEVARREREELAPYDEVFRETVALHQAGALTDVLPVYQKIVAQVPRHPGATHMLGVLAAQLGSEKLAKTMVEQALNFAPGDPFRIYNYGVLIFDEDPLDSAECFRAALTMLPDFEEAKSALFMAERGVRPPMVVEDAMAVARSDALLAVAD